MDTDRGGCLVRSHVCSVNGCNQAFTRSDHLKAHAKTHSGERPHSCPVDGCGAAFIQKSALRSHEMTHTGERPHVCPVEGCKASFIQSSALRSHERTHTGERPYSCPVDGCGAAFTTSGALRSHERIHTGERPHVCHVGGCGAAFARSGDLKTHEMIHTGERPYVCLWGSCGAAFNQRQAMKAHERTHTGERPHVCLMEECGAAFIRSDDLKSHQTRMHSEDGQRRQKKQEERVAKLLTSCGIDFKREHHVRFSCWGSTWARTDFIIIYRGGVLIIEVDEYQHDGYGVVCDVARMGQLFQAFLIGGNTLPVGIIRYNPHAFKVDGRTQKVLKKDREARLAQIIEGWQFAASGTLQVKYMYYDTDGDDLTIWKDPLYPDTMKQCCLPCVT